MSFRVRLFELIVDANREVRLTKSNMASNHIAKAYLKGLEDALVLYEKTELVGLK